MGDGAKIGSNAVVTKPVPAGATAVGNPARIIEAATDAATDADARREAAASKMAFSAYGVTQKDDPLSKALRSLMEDNRAQEQQIAQLWAAIEKLGGAAPAPDGAAEPNKK